MARSKKYQDFLIEELKDHDEAVAYLNAALEESLKGDEESKHLFLLALRNVVEAQGGISKLAKKLSLVEKVSIRHCLKQGIQNGTRLCP